MVERREKLRAAPASPPAAAFQNVGTDWSHESEICNLASSPAVGGAALSTTGQWSALPP